MKTLSLTCIALAAAVAGCGGDTTTTVSETKTVTVTAPPAQTAAPAQTPTVTAAPGSETATAPAVVAEPLPGGRVALDGKYILRARDTSFVGENIVAADGFAVEAWFMKPACTAGTCRVELRRSVKSGGYENVVLDEIGENRYAGTSTGKVECGPATRERFVRARTRFSVRVTATAQLDGRPTADRVDAYRTITARCVGQGVKGIVSMRGAREG